MAIDIVFKKNTPIDIDVISNGKPIDIDIGGLRPKEYTGTYEVTPLLQAEQELRTENRVLKQNVIVHEIPYAEVSNGKGKTLIIGE